MMHGNSNIKCMLNVKVFPAKKSWRNSGWVEPLPPLQECL